MGKTEKEKFEMHELRELKLRCDCISSCNVWGDINKDLEIRKLGARALKLVDDTIGEKIDVISSRYETISEKHNEDPKKTQEDPEYVSNYKEENKLWLQKEAFEFDPIEISLTRPDGADVSSKFPAEKVIGWRGRQYRVDPYEAVLDLITKGFFKIKQ